jgi:multisubunit Na+/H+ antiporter MnhB subunit
MWILFSCIVVAAMTVFFIYAYRDWMRTGRWRRNAALTLPVMALTSVIALQVIYHPLLMPERQPGFGPDWLCSGMKVSDTVCVKTK